MRSLLLLLTVPAVLAAQTVTPARDSIRLVVGQVDTSRAVLRGATGALAYTGTASTVFTAHRDGRLTALAVGCGYQRISFGEWTRAQVRVCVVAAPSAPPPVPTPGPAVLFRSDFDRPLAEVWPVRGRFLPEIVRVDALGFPMPWGIRVMATAENQGYVFLRTTALPPLAVGVARYYRWYFRPTMPNNLSDGESHPFQDGNAASQANWLFHVWHDRGGVGFWTPEFRANANVNVDATAHWFGPVLRKHATYRFELRIQRTTATTFTMQARVYDAAGVLLAGPEAWRDAQGQAGRMAMQTFTLRDSVTLNGLNAGNNGIASPAPFPFVYGYQGGIAVCADWCGAWRQP